MSDVPEPEVEDEGEEEGFEMHIAVPNLEDDAPPLTDEQIKFGMANHAVCIQQLIRVINAQEQSITTLMYIVYAYMKQYPLNFDAVSTEIAPAPAPTGQYL